MFAAVGVGSLIAAEGGSSAAVENEACAPVDGNGSHHDANGPAASGLTPMAYTGTPVSSPNETSNLVVTKTELGLASLEKAAVEAMTANCSPDRRHFAIMVRTEEGECMMLDGNKGKFYDRVYEELFSPDSKHLAYVAKSGGKYVVVVNGKEGKQYDMLWGNRIVFSPDGTRIAYAARLAAAGEGVCLVVDGAESKAYPAVSKPVFSPDSKHVACITGQESSVTADGVKGKGFLIVDGKEVRQVELTDAVIFSPDSAHWVCAVSNGGKWVVVKDGVDGKQYDGILGSPVFSSDSKHMAYLAVLDGKTVVVRDGEEGKKYMLLPLGGPNSFMLNDLKPMFSPDSQHFAYVAGEDNKYFIVMDGVEGKKYSLSVSVPLFSPDSKHLAYCAVEKGGSVLVVRDGVEGKEYRGVVGLLYSPDSSRLAYAADTPKGWCLVVNDAEGKLYSDLRIRNAIATREHKPLLAVAVFSSDSKHVAYVAKNEKSRYIVVVDDTEGKGYSYITNVTLSPDGKHVAYNAIGELGERYVVDGGEVGEPGCRLLTGLTFDSATKCHGLMGKATATLIEIEIKP